MMEFLGYSWLNYVVVILLLLISTLFFIRFHIYNYWKRRGLVQAEGSLPWGSLKDFLLGKKFIAQVYADIYKQGAGHPMIGYYSFLSPGLVIRNPDLLKRILVRDYDSFCDRGVYSNRELDPLSYHLFSTDGPQHREMRHVLSPSYSGSKMRFMFDTMQDCSHKLCEHLSDLVSSTGQGEKSLEIKPITNTYGLNVIASTAVGIDCNTFNGDNPLAEAALKVTDPDDIVQYLRLTLTLISPTVARLLNLRFTPKGVSDFYIDLVEKIVNHRKSENETRKDFMQVLLNMNEEIRKNEGADNRKPLGLDEIAAQTFLFILAGHETTSAAICFILYQLAVNQDVQNRLVAEIDSMNGDVNYDNIKDMEYLDMVLNETLRMYPAAPILIRNCVKNYRLPNGFVIEKGTQVLVPIYGLHMDPDYFPDPERFDPERFSKTAPSHTIHPFTFLPFGEGPRYCIGKRFGLASVKLGIINILSKFRVEPAVDTKIPLEIEKKTFVMNPYKGLTLKLVARDI
uniref:Cytochrome P450 CYP6ER4 n=1 Tax=Sogatella furcifera TaxID=113103 RepID=A0A1Q1NL11_SOGFU|nr:cytochrome P450 CYP6ER4 [Sogatella furcifera]